MPMRCLSDDVRSTAYPKKISPKLMVKALPALVQPLPLGTYHTAKKHPQIHSQLSLLVPSVCPFARPPRLAKTINCIPQPKILDPELPQQKQSNSHKKSVIFVQKPKDFRFWR
jgi:hypothetical protein